MIGKKLHNFFSSLLAKETCPNKLTLSVCVGVYIAFSPFIGFHTLMVFLFGWLFALNTAILFVVSVLINNPWTMIPVYGSGYVFGNWLFGTCGIKSVDFNPEWMIQLNVFLQNHINIPHLSLWSFLIGGNLLGLAFGVIVYPIVKRFLKHSHQRIMKKS